MLTKYILTIGTEKHEVSSEHIRNWDQVLCSYSRKDFNGVVRSFSSNFEFVGDAYDLLFNLYVKDGVRSEAMLSVQTITDRWEWETQFEVPLDFSTISWDGYALSIAAIDNSLASIISANKGTKYELLIGRDIKTDNRLNYDRVALKNMTTHQIMSNMAETGFMLMGENSAAINNAPEFKRLPVYIVGDAETFENSPVSYGDQSDSSGSYFLRVEKSEAEIKVETDITFENITNSGRIQINSVEIHLMQFVATNPDYNGSYVDLGTVFGYNSSVNRFVGYFLSLSQLKDTYPNPPQNVYAIIGTSHKAEDVQDVYYTPASNTDVVEWTWTPKKYRGSRGNQLVVCDIHHFMYTFQGSWPVGTMFTLMYRSNVVDTTGTTGLEPGFAITSKIKSSWKSRSKNIYIDALAPKVVAQTLLGKMADGKMNIKVHFDSDERLDNTLILAAESIRNISDAKFYSSFSEFCDWLQTVFGFTYYIGKKTLRRFLDKQTYYHTIYELLGMIIDDDSYFIPGADTLVLFYEPESSFFANSGNVLYRHWSGEDNFNDLDTHMAKKDVLFYSFVEGHWYYMSEDGSYSDYNYTDENIETDCLDTENIYFLHRDKLFSGEIQLALSDVRDATYSVDDSIIYSSVQVGYDKQDYETECGRDEWNFTNTYTTGVNVIDKTLSLISKYRADCYGLEFLAQKRMEDTTDNESDQDVFFVHSIFHEAESDDEESYYLLNRRLPISGSLSDDTVFNGEYSPFQCLKANARFISAMCSPLTLMFASSEGNSSIVIDGVSMASDITIDNPLFTIGKLSFTTGDVSFPDENSLVSICVNGVTYKGFISSITLKYARTEAAKYDLIVKEVSL